MIPLFRITEDTSADVFASPASLRESAGGGVPGACEEHPSAGGSSMPNFGILAAEGRYQDGCRYQLRYQLSDDSNGVTRKGSEVATSDHVFLSSYWSIGILVLIWVKPTAKSHKPMARFPRY